MFANQLTPLIARRFVFGALIRPSSYPHAAAAVWLVLYGCVLAIIQSVDVASADFDTCGLRLLGYNVARLLFLVYYVAIILGAGHIVLKWFNCGVPAALTFIDQVILHFFLGTAILTCVMFGLGILNCYYRVTALLLTIPILLVTFPWLCSTARECLARFLSHWRSGQPRALVALRIVLGIGLAYTTLLLTLTKVVYPGETTGDCYEHYWPYQALVIQNHGTYPNDVWYNFYTAKGLGLNFLAMLLGDRLMISGVGFLFLLASSAVLFSVARRLSGQADWAAVAAGVFLSAFLFSGNAWGGLQSHHVPAIAWLACMTWMIVNTREGERWAGPGWFHIWSFLGAAFALFFPLFMVFLVPQLVLWAGWWWSTKRSWSHGIMRVLLTLVGTITALLLFNYWVSGMLIDNPLRVSWALADQDKFSRWCSPYLVEYLTEGSGDAVGAINGISLTHLANTRFWYLFRLKFLAPLFPGPWMACGLTVALVYRLWRWRRDDLDRVRALVACLTVPAIAMIVAEILQIEPSIYRNYIFLMFYECCILAATWAALFSFIPGRLGPLFAGLVMVYVICGSTANATHRRTHKDAMSRCRNLVTYGRFAAGLISTREALQQGDGLWPELLAAKEQIGRDEPILCLTRDGQLSTALAAYFFPGSGLLTEPSATSFHGRWHEIAFGDADQAERILRSQGINHFIIDMKMDCFGGVVYSPLFEPETIEGRFQLAFRQGNFYVLTWRKEGGIPLPDEFVVQVCSRAMHWRTDPPDYPDARYYRLYQNVQAIYKANKAKSYPIVRPRDLDRVDGFQ
jgi:hypothetical protein